MSISAITITCGRPTLRTVALNMEDQKRKPDSWIIVADGEEAMSKVLACELDRYYSGNINYVLADNAMHRWSWDNLLHFGVPQITTKYACIMDDDNWFRPDHIDVLYRALETGHLFVSTLRFYSCEFGIPWAFENDDSLMFDANCIGIETGLLRDAAKFFDMFCKDVPKNRFSDRHLAFFVNARNIPILRVTGAKTVIYKVNPIKVDIEKLKDKWVLETNIIYDKITLDALKKKGVPCDTNVTQD